MYILYVIHYSCFLLIFSHVTHNDSGLILWTQKNMHLLFSKVDSSSWIIKMFIKYFNKFHPVQLSLNRLSNISVTYQMSALKLYEVIYFVRNSQLTNFENKRNRTNFRRKFVLVKQLWCLPIAVYALNRKHNQMWAVLFLLNKHTKKTRFLRIPNVGKVRIISCTCTNTLWILSTH